MATKWIKASDLEIGQRMIVDMCDYYVEDFSIDESLEDAQGNVRVRIYIEAKYFDGYEVSRQVTEFLFWPHEELEVWTR